jgi:Transglycosylase-like domain
LLTKRTYLVPVLIILLVFPAMAIAASQSGDGAGSAGRGRPARVAMPWAPSEGFERSVRAYARRFRAERRAAARGRRRELLAHLPAGVSMATLEAIASCESGGDPTAVSADGTYRGKYQFDYGTWESVGGHGDPAAASEAEQDYRAALLYERSGSSPWPVCG